MTYLERLQAELQEELEMVEGLKQDIIRFENELKKDLDPNQRHIYLKGIGLHKDLIRTSNNVIRSLKMKIKNEMKYYG